MYNLIDKVPLYEGTVYYIENNPSILSTNIKDLINKGYREIIAINYNAAHNGEINRLNCNNKEAVLYLTKYAKKRCFYIFDNNIIEEFEIDSSGFIIDYNFIFGVPYNFYDKIYTNQYYDNFIIGFYKTPGLGNDPKNYTRDNVLNAKFIPNRDLEIRYCIMDQDEEEVCELFDSSQFIKRED